MQTAGKVIHRAKTVRERGSLISNVLDHIRPLDLPTPHDTGTQGDHRRRRLRQGTTEIGVPAFEHLRHAPGRSQ